MYLRHPPCKFAGVNIGAASQRWYHLRYVPLVPHTANILSVLSFLGCSWTMCVWTHFGHLSRISVHKCVHNVSKLCPIPKCVQTQTKVWTYFWHIMDTFWTQYGHILDTSFNMEKEGNGPIDLPAIRTMRNRHLMLYDLNYPVLVCILPQTAILVASEAIAASKRPQR